MKKILTVVSFLSIVAFMTLITFTNGNAQDTDQNGVTENETQQGTLVVESVPQSSLAHALLDRVKTSWPWYTTRASGLVAGLALVILMISGSGFITGSTFRFLEPITAWATHRALGITLGVSVLIHLVTLYFDEFIAFDIPSLLIPFASDFNPVVLYGISFGSLYVALGVFAFYIFLAVILTSLLWINKKPRTWKAIHILSYVGMVFVFVHALYLGTDLAQGTLRYVWIGGGVLVTLVTIQRLWRVKTV